VFISLVMIFQNQDETLL